MAPNKHLLEKIHHLIVGFFLILKGADKLSHHIFLGGLILLFGLTVVAYFFYMVWAKSGGRTLHMLVHLFEAFALAFLSYIYFQEGKTYLQYVVLVASLGFFVSVFLYLRKAKTAPFE